MERGPKMASAIFCGQGSQRKHNFKDSKTIQSVHVVRIEVPSLLNVGL